ncbi:interleukin 12 receptor, beta 2a, like [Epinephelus moara]|uniref:interleukin 12 receptor, beta 2a, like n=1 Tax=Epinephelus moara TaxID=300413 RepID=UPI00214F588C|nr:interleukin 12 receptor, beta 2a, like [Epinephelus moara]
MATLRTRWLLSILLVNLPTCSASGPPAALSPPDCNIPCDEKDESNNCADIHCSWDPWLDPQIPTNYSLHWEPANNEEGHVISGTNLSGIILRAHFSHGDLHVWVQAKNQHGSAKSEKAMFNAEDIKKPPTPNVTLSYLEPLDIEWTFSCDELQRSFEHCDVRHRAEEDQVWVENKTGVHYTFDSHLPYTVYEFQVRCSCDKSLSSDWSAIHRVRTPEMAPVGELDLWRDCGTSQATSDCFLTWKRLPTSQARGLIWGYEVRLTYNNGTAVLVNMSTAGSEGRLVCDEMQCHFNLSLKDVSSASVSAYNALGATVPSYLTMPISGKEKNEPAIHLKMNEDSLTVSWGLPSQLSDNLKEYVVQYNQAGCPPGRQFDWIKVNKSQTTGIFKGQYKKYTPYQVSLFTVSHSNEVHHLSSVIGYSLEGTPSTGPSFKVSIADTHVNLFWEPVPLCMQNGVILSYEVIADGGENGQKVYNVSASPQQENMTFKLQDLSPGQQYDVWIRAVTAAGPGANSTMKVKTKHLEDFAILKPLLLGIIFVIFVCFIVVLYRAHQGECPLVPTFLYEKVPDARNSHIFRHMKHQINDPLAWICIPVYEPHPIISVLEVVEIQPRADGLTQPVVGDQCSQTDCQDDQGEEAVMEECHRTDRRYGREEYSRMVDSDEERDRKEEHREDSWSSAEDEQSTSGYEKHFMPTELEVLEV